MILRKNIKSLETGVSLLLTVPRRYFCSSDFILIVLFPLVCFSVMWIPVFLTLFGASGRLCSMTVVFPGCVQKCKLLASVLP